MEVSSADGTPIRRGAKHSRCRIGIQDLQGSVDGSKPLTMDVRGVSRQAHFSWLWAE